MREIRDEPRAVEGAPPVPDVLALQASRVWSGTVWQPLAGSKWLLCRSVCFGGGRQLAMAASVSSAALGASFRCLENIQISSLPLPAHACSGSKSCPRPKRWQLW